MNKKIVAIGILLMFFVTIATVFVNNDSEGFEPYEVTDNIKLIYNPEIIELIAISCDEYGEKTYTTINEENMKLENSYTEFYARADSRYFITLNGTIISSTLTESREFSIDEMMDFTYLEAYDRTFTFAYYDEEVIAYDLCIDDTFYVDKYSEIDGYKGIWNTSVDGSGIDFFAGNNTLPHEILDNITEINWDYVIILYPKATEIFTLFLDANGGYMESDDVWTYKDGPQMYIGRFNEFSEIDLPTPIRSEHTFDGWFDEFDNKITEMNGLTRTTELKAKWTEITPPQEPDGSEDIPGEDSGESEDGNENNPGQENESGNTPGENPGDSGDGPESSSEDGQGGENTPGGNSENEPEGSGNNENPDENIDENPQNDPEPEEGQNENNEENPSENENPQDDSGSGSEEGQSGENTPGGNSENEPEGSGETHESGEGIGDDIEEGADGNPDGAHEDGTEEGQSGETGGNPDDVPGNQSGGGSGNASGGGSGGQNVNPPQENSSSGSYAPSPQPSTPAAPSEPAAYMITVYESADADEPYAVIAAGDELPTIEREGYEFAGWRTADGEDFDMDAVYCDTDVYGEWDEIVYEDEPTPVAEKTENMPNDTLIVTVLLATTFLMSFLAKVAYPRTKQLKI